MFRSMIGIRTTLGGGLGSGLPFGFSTGGSRILGIFLWIATRSGRLDDSSVTGRRSQQA